MEVWKSSVLSKWVICRLRVNLPGCVTMQKKKQQQFCLMQREWQQTSANESFHQEQVNDNDRADNQVKKALEYRTNKKHIALL